MYSTREVSSSSRFSKPKLDQTGFTIDHYAGQARHQPAFLKRAHICKDSNCNGPLPVHFTQLPLPTMTIKPKMWVTRAKMHLR